MSFFIILILIGAYFQTLYRLSFIKRKSRYFLLFSIIFTISCCYKHAANYNLNDLSKFLENANTLTTICLIVIIQEIVSLVTTAILLRKKILSENVNFINKLALTPSLLFPLSQFLLVIFVFNKMSGINYFLGSVTVGFLLLIFSIISCEIIQLMSFEKISKMNFSSSLTLIFLAMFLPVILTNSKPATNYITIDISMLYGLIFIGTIVIILAILTPLLNKIKHKFLQIILK
ncbi:hypothetical protein AAEX28_01380 [Lentisphaerota bacterium WC36G]|nr:hypothetical protein LJT99_04265 [Lentisphaerae bacterium WC36]